MVDKKTVAMLVAEFLGAAVLTLVVLSVRGSAIGIPYFVAIAAGLTVGLTWLTSGGVLGVQMNPAVTLGLWTIRKIQTAQAVLNIAFQLLGAYAALGIFTYFTKTHLQSVAGHYDARVMLAEAVGAFVFSFGIAAAIYKEYDALLTAVVGGLAFVVGIIVASTVSNGLINPAVALGIKSWSWGTYVLGPVVGAVVGMNLYSLVFADVANTKTAKAKKK
jgi:glycerol uptake facilitator-like aquaporin